MIAIKAKCTLGNVAYVRGTIGGQWNCTLANGTPAAFSYAHLPRDRDETGFRIRLRQVSTPAEALALCQKEGWGAEYTLVDDGGPPTVYADMLAALRKIAATERRNMTPARRLALIYEVAGEAIAKAEGRADEERTAPAA